MQAYRARLLAGELIMNIKYYLLWTIYIDDKISNNYLLGLLTYNYLITRILL